MANSLLERHIVFGFMGLGFRCFLCTGILWKSQKFLTDREKRMNKPKNFSEVLDVIEKMKCCGNCRHYEVGYAGANVFAGLALVKSP